MKDKIIKIKEGKIMKTKLFIMLLAIAGCIACEKEMPVETPQPETPIEGEPGPPAIMTIVKFADQSQLDYVIVQHPLYGNDGLHDVLLYNEDTTLTLNCKKSFEPSFGQTTNSALNPMCIDVLQNELSVLGTSPYIPLAEGYYLIDWKWMELMPLSSTTNIIAHPKQFYAHIRDHCFITNTKWSELDDLYKEWDRDQVSLPINISTIYHIGYEEVDRYLGLYKKSKWSPYESIYYWGTFVSNAAMYFYDDGFPNEYGASFEGYCSLLDSVQNAFIQPLVEIIENNKFQDVLVYEYKFN